MRFKPFDNGSIRIFEERSNQIVMLRYDRNGSFSWVISNGPPYCTEAHAAWLKSVLNNISDIKAWLEQHPNIQHTARINGLLAQHCVLYGTSPEEKHENPYDLRPTIQVWKDPAKEPLSDPPKLIFNGRVNTVPHRGDVLCFESSGGEGTDVLEVGEVQHHLHASLVMVHVHEA